METKQNRNEKIAKRFNEVLADLGLKQQEFNGEDISLAVPIMLGHFYEIGLIESEEIEKLTNYILRGEK